MLNVWVVYGSNWSHITSNVCGISREVYGFLLRQKYFDLNPKKKNRLINVPTEVADNKCLIKFLSVAQLHVLAIFIERDIFRGIPRVESRTLDHQRGTIYLNYENRQDKFIRCINQYGYLLLFVLVPGKCSYVKKLVWETSTTAGKLSRRRIRFI